MQQRKEEKTPRFAVNLFCEFAYCICILHYATFLDFTMEVNPTDDLATVNCVLL